MIRHARRELRRRAAESDAPLTESVEALLHGHRPVLRVGRKNTASTAEAPAGPVDEHPDDTASTAQFTLGLPSSWVRTAEHVLRKRRLTAAGWSALVVIGMAALATPYVLARAAGSDSPETRTISLDYLTPTSWDTEVWADYVVTDRERQGLAGLISEGMGDPQTIDRSWTLIVDSAGGSPGKAPFEAYLHVVGLSEVSAEQAGENFLSIKGTPDASGTPPVGVPDLPSDWTGMLTDGAESRAAVAVGHADDLVVMVTVTGEAEDAELTREMKDLVGAIAKRGIVEFAADTERDH